MKIKDMKNKSHVEIENKQVELTGHKDETEERIIHYTKRTENLKLMKNEIGGY
jgi:hypothetical protein